MKTFVYYRLQYTNVDKYNIDYYRPIIVSLLFHLIRCYTIFICDIRTYIIYKYLYRIYNIIYIIREEFLIHNSIGIIRTPLRSVV